MATIYTAAHLIKVLVGDLSFEDANAGLVTLSDLLAGGGGGTMKNVWINVSGQAPGNLTLNDGTNWDVSYSYITAIHVLTSSTDWDLWLCEDNSFDTGAIETHRLVSGRSGDMDISVAREYNPGDTNVYLKYTDNSGSNNADIYILGQERTH